MSFHRLLDRVAGIRMFFILFAFLLCSPGVVLAHGEGLGFDHDDPQFKLVWGISFVCAVIALLQAYFFISQTIGELAGRLAQLIGQWHCAIRLIIPELWILTRLDHFQIGCRIVHLERFESWSKPGANFGQNVHNASCQAKSD